ncbi:LysR family transcriptional regulator [Xaviernesmea oryzae]|uniref:LysR family transcriptional regulator n=1 Tax=Xaviernesmea oryzae TaxID=464029 RepID=UPI0008B9D5DA|nr:LysR family transcriptional regulator [Xaviernesmea oryzae]SEM00686.1 regulatory helix-turn-helix protein, lysR family [Xaviernesmea oryzae]
MIETRRLRYLVTAARSGSFRATAKLFDVNPSSVSRQIRQLEYELGVALFIRHSSGVAPTLAGHRMAETARKFMEQFVMSSEGYRVKNIHTEPQAQSTANYGDSARDYPGHSFLYPVHCA